jgi:glycosyltransferase involved in cell wall biosynthesis
MMQVATTETARVIAEGRAADWQAFVTYHCYYKAPDLIGPTVSRALGIPYILIEATRARKRLGGPWDAFARAAEASCDAAQAICYLTARDAEGLRQYTPEGQSLVHLRPFLPRTDLPARSSRRGPMLSVGMMRSGDKLGSYRIIAETLALLETPHWQLEIAGDGQDRTLVEALMEPFGDRVRFLGQLDADGLNAAYARASLLFWPGVNEAFGLSYLEAQAHGLPVVAQDRPGVRDVLAPGDHPAPEAGAAALAARLTDLLNNPARRDTRGAEASAHVATHHLMPAASWTLRQTLKAVLP